MTAAPRPESLRRTRTPELAVHCPWCRAQPGDRCVSKRGRVRTTSHPSRTPPALGNP